MNTDQMLSLLRTVLQIAGTIVVAHATLGINGALWEQISGVVIVVAPTIWGLLTHTDAANIAKVAANPDVQKIVVSSQATDGTGAALADPAQIKVVSQ